MGYFKVINCEVGLIVKALYFVQKMLFFYNGTYFHTIIDAQVFETKTELQVFNIEMVFFYPPV